MSYMRELESGVPTDDIGHRRSVISSENMLVSQEVLFTRKTSLLLAYIEILRHFPLQILILIMISVLFGSLLCTSAFVTSHWSLRLRPTSSTLVNMLEVLFKIDGCPFLGFKISTTVHWHYCIKSQDIFLYNSDCIHLKEGSLLHLMAWGWVNHGFIFIFGWTWSLCRFEFIDFIENQVVYDGHRLRLFSSRLWFHPVVLRQTETRHIIMCEFLVFGTASKYDSV